MISFRYRYQALKKLGQETELISSTRNEKKEPKRDCESILALRWYFQSTKELTQFLLLLALFKTHLQQTAYLIIAHQLRTIQMKLKSLLALFTVLGKTFADVSIAKPIKGETFTAKGNSVTIPIVWAESQSSPLLKDIDIYSFTICTGPNTEINGIKTLKRLKANEIKNNSYDLEIPTNIGGDGNYFVQIHAKTKEGGFTIHYSYRFKLKGMKGFLNPSGDDATPPSAEIHEVRKGDSTETLSPDDISRSMQIWYTEQTGITRYAPMQTQPGTRVTAKTWSKKYPTSSVSYFTKLETNLQQFRTNTPPWTYTISSAVNWATPAPYPSDNGGWYDPKEKVNSPSLSILSTSRSSSM